MQQYRDVTSCMYPLSLYVTLTLFLNGPLLLTLQSWYHWSQFSFCSLLDFFWKVLICKILSIILLSASYKFIGWMELSKSLRYLPKITNTDDTDNDDYQKSPGSFSLVFRKQTFWVNYRVHIYYLSAAAKAVPNP